MQLRSPCSRRAIASADACTRKIGSTSGAVDHGTERNPITDPCREMTQRDPAHA
jgi:hypothetical protein